MSKRIKVSVLKEDIKRGVSSSSYLSPTARAILRTFKKCAKGVVVNRDSILFMPYVMENEGGFLVKRDGGKVVPEDALATIKTPKKVNVWEDRLANDQKVAPFSFTITVPDNIAV